MPREEGIIIKDLPDGSLVLVKKPEGCHNCPSAKLCYMGGTGERKILARNPIGAKEGETVEIEVPDSLMLKASFIVYILPIFALIAGALIGKWLVKTLGMPFSQETGAVTGGLTFLVLTFILIRLKSTGRSHMRKYQPTIIKTKQL